MSERTFGNLAEVAALVGQEVAVSEWFVVSQEQVDEFARATGDRQWIHVDPERARQGPFGRTIAHGFLTLSMLPMLLESAMCVRSVTMALNYGLNRVRFTAPVPVGSRVRGKFTLLASTPEQNHGVRQVWEVLVEREDADKPACVAQLVVLQFE